VSLASRVLATARSADEPRNGVDGWDLVAYAWNHEDEIGRFTYERELEGQEEPEVKEIARWQPGWLRNK